MKVRFGNQLDIPKKPNYVKFAAKGAFASSAIYSGFTAVSAFSQQDLFKKVVEEVGGKKEYMKTYLIAMGIIALGGAILGTIVGSISSKLNPSENPKAN